MIIIDNTPATKQKPKKSKQNEKKMNKKSAKINLRSSKAGRRRCRRIKNPQIPRSSKAGPKRCRKKILKSPGHQGLDRSDAKDGSGRSVGALYPLGSRLRRRWFPSRYSRWGDFGELKADYLLSKVDDKISPPDGPGGATLVI